MSTFPAPAERDAPIVAVTASSMIIDGARRVRVNQSYVDALVDAGAAPFVVPPMTDPARAAALLDVADGVVLTGGEDVDPAWYGRHPHPATGAPHHDRDACELAVALEARERRMPTLAICRGIQLINVAFGGTLVQDIPALLESAIVHDARGERNARTHRVRIEPGSALAAAIGDGEVRSNSFHHQSLDAVPPLFRVTARADDGVIEGIESADPDWWMLGVQWHPEDLTRTAEPWDRALFAAFVRAAVIPRGPTSLRR